MRFKGITAELVNNGQRTDKEVLVVSVCMILISLVFIAVVLSLVTMEKGTSAEYSVNSPVGWVAVVGAAVVFGSTGIPMKSPSLKTLNVDSLVYCLYNSVGIVISTIPLILYKVATNTFYFQVYGILGAANIFIVGYFAFMAVQTLGYAIAPALWCGIGMISAFIWGAIVFKEEVNHLAGGIVSMLLLGAGVYIMSTLTRTSAEDEYNEGDARSDVGEDDESAGNVDPTSENKDNVLYIDAQEDDEDKSDESKTESKMSMFNISRRKTLEGITYCLLTGLCDGAMMVPFKLSNVDTISTAFDYIVSFALASSLVAPIMFCMYCIFRYLYGKDRLENAPIISFQAEAAFVPGVLSGALWSLANFLSCHATFYLGMKIGFPLTQTCILFTTCWGIFYFNEIDITPKMVKLTFATGLVLLLLGSYILSSFG